MPRQFTTIGVVGLGTMGAGIAEVFARHGFDVVGVEQTPEQLDLGRSHLESSTGRALKRGSLTKTEHHGIFDRLELTTALADLARCDAVIEAVVERLDVKRSIFRQLDEVVRADAVLATNTSSLSVTEISAATSHPGRVVGMHFFNPAPVQRLVEVIHTVVTEPDVTADVQGLAHAIGKNPVVVGDRAGFIANALLFGYLNRAVSLYESRYAGRDDIDAAMRAGCGYPMGPLALLDLIGLDTAYQILDTMYREGRNRLHSPAPILKQMVTAGLLGRKTGRGFYRYDEPNSSRLLDDAETPSRVAHTGARPVATVGVVGSGALAEGLAGVFAKAGYDVVAVALRRGETDRLREAVAQSLTDAGQSGELEPEVRDTALSHLVQGAGLMSLAQVDLVVEAISEDLEAKTALLRQLDEICREGAIFVTTTSSLSVIELACATRRRPDVIGMHFGRPAHHAELVEVVSTVITADAVRETVLAMCSTIGIRAVSCGDRAGFLVNALLFPYLNDAARMLESRYADVDAIDTAMRDGCALPMGPFQVLDNIGLDVSLAIERRLFVESGEPGLAPAPLLQHLVTVGYLGRKTGRGFRDHGSE